METHQWENMRVTSWKAGEALATTTACSTESQAVPLLLQPQSRAHSCFKPHHGHAGAQRSQDGHTVGATCPREAFPPLQGQAI